MKLQNIRHARHIKWPIYILFAFIIISFIFFYGWNQGGKNGGDGYNQNFAKMRSDSLHPLRRWIYLDQVALRNHKHEAISEKFNAMPPLPEQIQQMIMQQNILENLVTTEDVARVSADSILLDRTARDMGVQVTFQDMLDLLKTQPGISDEMLQANAESMGLPSKAAYVEAIAKDQEQRRVREIKGMVAHASLYELWQEYSLSNEKLVLRLAAYPAEAFESKVAVTPADLEKYLAEHKSEFYVPAMRRYNFVKIERSDLLNAIKPTKEQLQVYYEKHQSQYVEKPATRIREIWSPLAENAATTVPLRAFNAVKGQAAAADSWSSITANLTQAHPGTEFFERERWVEDEDETVSARFKSQLKTMDANKGTSVVIDSEGVHLVKVLATRSKGVSQFGTPDFEKIRQRVEADYKEAKAEEDFKAEVQKLKDERNKLVEDKNTTVSVHALAQRIKRNDQLTTRVEASSADIPEVGNFDRDAGYLAALTPGEVSEVLETPEVAVVLQVVDHKEGYDPAFAEVKDKVEKAYRKSRAVELAKQAAQQGMNLVKGGAEFDKALADAPKKPFDTPELTRLDSVKGLDAPLIGFKQQTLKINTGNTGMSPYGTSEDKPTGYAVWRVQKLIEPKQEEFEKERNRFEQDYLQVARETIVREWLADQRRKAQYHYLTAEEKK